MCVDWYALYWLAVTGLAVTEFLTCFSVDAISYYVTDLCLYRYCDVDSDQYLWVL